MFNFLKSRKQKTTELDEGAIRKQQKDFIAEHNYKMKHDPEYRKSIERSRAFFKADHEAEEKAGLTDKLGTYTFICPNCGSECKGEWVRFDALGSRHGHTGCHTCNIHLMV